MLYLCDTHIGKLSGLRRGGLEQLTLPWEEQEDGANWPGALIAVNPVYVWLLGDSFSSGVATVDT